MPITQNVSQGFIRMLLRDDATSEALLAMQWNIDNEPAEWMCEAGVSRRQQGANAFGDSHQSDLC